MAVIESRQHCLFPEIHQPGCSQRKGLDIGVRAERYDFPVPDREGFDDREVVVDGDDMPTVVNDVGPPCGLAADVWAPE